MPDTWLAMLISLARRKPRAVGAVLGEEGAACSWKTALWAWSASAAGGQGPETAGKEASPSPALQPPSSGRGRPACVGAGAAGVAAVQARPTRPAAEEQGHLSKADRVDGPKHARARLLRAQS